MSDGPTENARRLLTWAADHIAEEWGETDEARELRAAAEALPDLRALVRQWRETAGGKRVAWISDIKQAKAEGLLVCAEQLEMLLS